MDSNASNGSTASSATASSTKPLNPVQRQNTGFSKPAWQNSDYSGEKAGAGGRGYYGGEVGASQTPYMNMLLSLDKIPRMHNILVSVFVWILLVGFVIMPGSFTSLKRKQDGQSVMFPVGEVSGEKRAITPGNTAAMVVGFACIVAGLFGSAWLALRWRRNYVWLLNKLYLPLVFNALAGVLTTVTNVYTQQVGEWSTQAIIAIVIEASVLGTSFILFVVYNYWLLRRVRSEYEEQLEYGNEKTMRRKRKAQRRVGLFARFRRVRRQPPIAAGSVV
ncbi:2a480a41-21f9-4083-ad49-37d2db8d5f7e [Thermothielavioides terrestris]|uniref:2a480a41-21f9-4083-ad49-37d2db8d5f7e n=1 Tax=Thermothielavioides terrestris TaxID=2587410 RepID=A0A3S4F1S9_9PEZI|nr:2a480a41-21f9-4083-ad49-37d2db8d5f7e [Thermothielavioides terrestris]